MSEELRAMDDEIVVRMIVDLDARVERIEKVLPSLATKAFVEIAIRDGLAPLPTKADLAEAVAPLATKAELGEAVAPLATKADLADAMAEARRHFSVVGESLRADMRVLAEGAQTADLRQQTSGWRRDVDDLGRRL